MALRDLEGFDYFQTVTDRFSILASNASCAINSGASRSVGGQGLQFTNINNTGGGGGIFKSLGFSMGTRVFIQIAVNTQGNWGFPLLTLLDSAGVGQIGFSLQTSGAFYVQSGGPAGSVLASGFGPSLFSYNSYQIDLTLGTGTAGSVKVYANGSATPFINQSSIATQATANPNVAAYIIGTNGGTTGPSNGRTAFFDDFLIYDNTGSDFNTLLADVAVRGYLPIGDGATQNFTRTFATWSTGAKVIGQQITDGTNVQQVITGGNSGGSAPSWNTTVGGNTTDGSVTWKNMGTPADYKAVNEPDPDGNNSYLASSVVGDIELFTYPSIASGTVIYAAVPMPFSEKDDAGTRIERAYCKSGATSADSGVDFALGSTYAYPATPQVFYRDPNTGALFTVTGYNNAQFGIKNTA